MAKFFKYATSVLAGWLATAQLILESNFPLVLVCFMFILIDAWTAKRLGVRVAQRYPEAAGHAGKFQSKKGVKITDSMLRVIIFVIAADVAERFVFPFLSPLYLANWMAGTFLINQLWSMLENESSCNPDKWAQVVQKFAVDKTKRHLHIDLNKVFEDEKETNTMGA